MNRAKNHGRILQDFSKGLGTGSGVQPGHDFGHAAGSVARRDGGSVDQDDRKAKGACGAKLCLRPHATGVLGDDHVDPVVAQQGKVAFDREGTSGDDGMGVGQRQGIGRRIDKAQKIVVLRGLGESGQGLATDGKEHPVRALTQCFDGSFMIGDKGPVVAFACSPWRAFQSDQGRVGFGAGGDGIRAHLSGERVGRVDHIGDGFGLDIGLKAFDAAKAADADGQRLGDLGFGTAGIGIDGIHACISQRAGHLRGFGGSAQKKDTRHG